MTGQYTCCHTKNKKALLFDTSADVTSMQVIGDWCNWSMAKEETISMEGRVKEILPNTMFRVLLDDVNTEVIAYLSGKMRTHNIKVLLGDRVAMEFSPYDLTRGRITRRR